MTEENTNTYIFVAKGVDLHGKTHEAAYASFQDAQDFLEDLAVKNGFEQDVVDTMTVARFSVDKVLKPDITLKLVFSDTDSDSK